MTTERLPTIEDFPVDSRCPQADPTELMSIIQARPGGRGFFPNIPITTDGIRYFAGYHAHEYPAMAHELLALATRVDREAGR